MKEIARAYLNGHELGITTFSPHVFDVTKIVRADNIHLVVEVANTRLNRLTADDHLLAEYKSTRTRLTQGPRGNHK